MQPDPETARQIMAALARYADALEVPAPKRSPLRERQLAEAVDLADRCQHWGCDRDSEDPWGHCDIHWAERTPQR